MLAMFFSVVMRGWTFVFDGVLLGGQAKGVEAHGVQDVVAAHAFVAGDDVGGDVAQRVADVQPDARGVGEHVHAKVLGLAGVKPFVAGVPDVEGLGVGPALLPLSFDLLEVVFHGAEIVVDLRFISKASAVRGVGLPEILEV